MVTGGRNQHGRVDNKEDDSWSAPNGGNKDNKEGLSISADNRTLNVDYELAKKETLAYKFKTTTVLWWVGAVTFFVGYTSQVVSFATPYWIVTYDVNGTAAGHLGVWTNCTSTGPCNYRDMSSNCLKVVRVVGITGAVCGLPAAVILVCYIGMSTRRRCLATMVISLCFLSAAATQIYTTLFGRTTGCDSTADVKGRTWAWSTALSFSSVVVTGCAGLMFLGHQLRGCSTRTGNI